MSHVRCLVVVLLLAAVDRSAAIFRDFFFRHSLSGKIGKKENSIPSRYAYAAAVAFVL